MAIERLITKLEQRAAHNWTAEQVGVRPVGRFRARILVLQARLDELLGESPEHIDDLTRAAGDEITLDDLATKVARVSLNSDNN